MPDQQVKIVCHHNRKTLDMKTNTKKCVLAALGLFMLAAAQLSWSAPDVRGSKDHPMLTRFTGATISAYSQQDYDEASMPNQPIANDRQ
jgi:hypothetical protein